jgi:dihydrofolate synthase/folylpolyglutamate synthase
VILDGAHNPPGAEAAVATLDGEFEVDGRRILVVGLLADKDTRAMLEALDVRRADLVVACRPDSPRATPPEELASVARSLGVRVDVVPDVAAAVAHAVDLAAEDDVVLVVGSLYVVGAARTGLRSARPPDRPTA